MSSLYHCRRIKDAPMKLQCSPLSSWVLYTSILMRDTSSSFAGLAGGMCATMEVRRSQSTSHSAMHAKSTLIRWGSLSPRVCRRLLGQALFVTEEAPIVPALYYAQPNQKRSGLACRGSTAHSVFKFTGRRILTALMEKRYWKNDCILDSWWVLLFQLPSVLLPSIWALSVIYHLFTLFHAIEPFLFAVGWLW
jgi:hypothetical protein